MNTFFAICLFLTFRFVDGKECSFPTDGLSVSVENHALIVKSAELTATLPINELVSMRFTDSAVSLPEVNNVATFEVYSLKGESLGSFKSFVDLKKSIPGGCYILRQGNNSIKISI